MSNLNEDRADGPAKLDQERGLPPVNGRKTSGKAGKILAGAALVVVMATMAWLNLKPKSEPVEQEEQSVSQTRRSLPPLELQDTPPPPPVATPEQPPAAGTLPPPGTPQGAPAAPQGPTEEELLLQRRQRAPIIAYGGRGASDNAGGAQPGALPGQAQEDDGDLSVALRGTRTDAVSASMLTDRNFLIAKGTFLDCALITAISSTQPGMTSCRLTRNVYSDNGKVLLLERGSIIEGEYKSGQMRQGMERIFVLWTRVRTPKGVAIKLDSPGADELGRSGLQGWVDTHFWKRYGGALLLSLVDASTEYAVAKQSSGDQGEATIELDGAGNATQQAAAIALQNSINIPPTLNKNQGDLINIYVARDLDFRSVYELRRQ